MRNNTLTFGLVTAPVGVVPARKQNPGGVLKMVAPYQRDAKGNLPARATKVSQVYIDPGAWTKVKGQQMLPASAVFGKEDLNGYRAVERGADANGETIYQPVDGAALEDAIERLDSMAVEGFVPARDAELYYDRVYDCHYLQPRAGTPPTSLSLLAEAMRREKVVAVVKFSVGARERAGIVRTRDDGCVEVLSVAFGERCTEPPPEARAVAEARPDRKQLEMARSLVRAMTVDASLIDDLRDETAARQEDVVAQVLATEPPPEGRTKKPQATDLMDLLSQSVEAARAAA